MMPINPLKAIPLEILDLQDNWNGLQSQKETMTCKNKNRDNDEAKAKAHLPCGEIW
jgi:hypothetical protein